MAGRYEVANDMTIARLIDQSYGLFRCFKVLKLALEYNDGVVTIGHTGQ